MEPTNSTESSLRCAKSKEGLSGTGRAASSTEWLLPVAAVEGTSASAMASTSYGQRISGQGLLKGKKMTVMDLDRRLCYLSLNSALRFATMSSSSSFLQFMGGTTGSTFASSSVLVVDRSTFVSGSVWL